MNALNFQSWLYRYCVYCSFWNCDKYWLFFIFVIMNYQLTDRPLSNTINTWIERRGERVLAVDQIHAFSLVFNSILMPRHFGKNEALAAISFMRFDRKQQEVKYKRISLIAINQEKSNQFYIESMEADGYALYVDNSGSVGGSANYWETVEHIIAQYGKDITQFYLWNSTCGASSLKEFEGWIKSRKGTGGTSPEHVATEIVKKRHSKIILVTDGQVDNSSVQRCDQTFEEAEKNGFKIAKSVCYIVSTGYGGMNMSVTCPFTRFCDNQVFTKEKDQPLVAVVQYNTEDFKILDTLEEISLENFEAKYDLIEGLIIALNMGKSGNIPLKNQLVNMKNRVVKELSKKMSKEFDYSKDMREHLEKGNFEGAIEVAKVMSLKYFSEDATTDIEKKISHLINLCGDLRGQYSIGQIKSNKMAIATTAKEVKIDQSIEIQDLSKNIIECPIIMDEDVPQILIDQCEPFLLGVEKHIVDDIAACPLRILNYPELRAKFKASISTFTGVKYSDKILKNPFTQNRLLGAIPLGTHKNHIEVGNHTIAKLIAGGKIMGNLNLYYAVIWYLINEGEIEYLKPIHANVTEHLLYRLKNSKTMASLCGLAQFVTTQIDADVAIWYCVSSGYLNQPTDRDTFRFHFYNIDPMIKIVEVLGYPLHEGTRAHLNRTKALLNLLSYFKKLSTNEKKAFQILFKCLYQKAVYLSNEVLEGISPKFKELEVVTPFVPIDGEATPEQIAKIRERLPKYCAPLSVEELYHISTLLNAQKSASDIFLDYNIKVPALPKAEVNWCYGLSQIDESKVQFNPKTLRPFYTVAGKKWDQCAIETFKVSDVNELFKGCKYLENYIQKYEKRPEYAELLLFYFNRYVEAGKQTTLPFLSEMWAHELAEKFNKASEGLEVPKILEIIEKTRPIQKRIEIEQA